MSRTKAIAWREFRTTVRRGSYILATLGTPLFFLIVAGISAIPSMVAVRRELAERRQLAVVDESGLLSLAAIEANGAAADAPNGAIDEILSRLAGKRKGAGPRRVRLYEDKERAAADLRAGRIRSFYVVPRDYLATGAVEYRSRRHQFLWDTAGSGGPLRPLLIEGLLAGKVDAERRARARRPITDVRTLALGPDGEFAEQRPIDSLSRLIIPFAFSFILMLSIFIASGYLIQGLAEEKSTRVIELLLSSVTPEELIAGKLIGLGAAGLLQLSVWVAAAAAPVLLVGWLKVSAAVVILSVAYYLLGFLFYGSIMAGLGCISGGTQESQQFASLWSVVAVLPMVFSPLILEAPNGVLSRVLSYVPLTCPITMIMRCGVGELAWWDVPLSMAVMVGAIYLSLKLSGRLFRAGLLLHGQRPTLGELVAALRAT